MKKCRTELKDKILEITAPLFLEEGFDGVDMRTIACRADIAVGTLYNYFPSKRVLFFAVFERGWEEVFSRINGLIEGLSSPREKINLFLKEFHKSVLDRRGLGQELLKLTLDSPKEKERFRKVELRLKDQLINIFRETKLEEEFYLPLARCLLSSTWNVSRENSSQADNHFQFIDWLLNLIIENKGEQQDE